MLGTDHQIQRLRVLIRPEQKGEQTFDEDVELFNYVIRKESFLANKTIRESGLREQANALMVGIQRGTERILNPESDLRLEVNDNLFIVGNRRRVKDFLAHVENREG